MKKTVSLLLSLVMLISIIAGLEMNVYAANDSAGYYPIVQSVELNATKKFELENETCGYWDKTQGVFHYIKLQYCEISDFVNKGDKLTVKKAKSNGLTKTFVYQFDGEKFVDSYKDELWYGVEDYVVTNGRTNAGWVPLSCAQSKDSVNGTLNSNLNGFDTIAWLTLVTPKNGWHTIRYEYGVNYGDLEEVTYYVKNNRMVTGFQTIGGKKYYFYDTGKMATRETSINGKEYFFGTNGVMYTGWRTEGKNKMYYASDGHMLKYSQKIDNKWYYFNGYGIMQTGWISFSNGKKYYNATGVMQTYTTKIGDKWYYFNGNGIMQTGWIRGKNTFYADKNGVLKTGRQTIDGKRYLFKYANAQMIKGWYKTSNGVYYYFNNTGAMVTGWQKISNKWYYFNSNGTMKTGWLKSGGKWYYLDSSGAMLANTSRKIGGKTYKYDASGACTNP